MPHALLVANLRGHTGKTTLAVHLAASWARGMLRGALLDVDPEGHLAHHLGIPVLKGCMSLAGTQEDVYCESAFRLEGDAPWRAHLDVFPWSDERPLQRISKDVLGYDFVLIDTPPRDVPALLQGLVLLATLKRAGWDVHVIVPHGMQPLPSRGTLSTIEFVERVHRHAGVYFPITVVPILPAERREQIASPSRMLPFSSVQYAPVLSVQPQFREAARFGLTVYELPSTHLSVQELDAIAQFLLPEA